MIINKHRTAGTHVHSHGEAPPVSNVRARAPHALGWIEVMYALDVASSFFCVSFVEVLVDEDGKH